MTSHQVYNEESMRSPRKETPKMNPNDAILYEVSPTGIMGFPEGNGKPLVQRPGMPTLGALDSPHDEKMELQMRFSSTHKYWNTVEQDLLNGRQDFIIPRAQHVFGGFFVSEGHVKRLVHDWNLKFQPSLPALMAAGVPLPGEKVLKLVEFYNHFAEQRMHHDAMEPFVVYKTLSDKLRQRVAELEANCFFVPPTVVLESPVVYRQVSAKLQPLVTWWNTAFQAPVPVESLEPLRKNKNPRVVVMANLMKKKIEHMDCPKEEASAVNPHSNHLVLHMVSLLEAINYRTKTGAPHPLDTNPVHQVKPLPLVC